MRSRYYYTVSDSVVNSNLTGYTKVIVSGDKDKLSFLVGILGTNGAGESDSLTVGTIYDLGDNLKVIQNNLESILNKGIDVVVDDIGIQYTKGCTHYKLLSYYAGISIEDLANNSVNSVVEDKVKVGNKRGRKKKVKVVEGMDLSVLDGDTNISENIKLVITNLVLKTGSLGELIKKFGVSLTDIVNYNEKHIRDKSITLYNIIASAEGYPSGLV